MTKTNEEYDVMQAIQAQPTLNLFPTENRMSPRALQALSSDAVHRYPLSEGDGFYYGNTGDLSRMYRHCESLACQFFGARYTFINFLSGLHTLQSLLMALSSPGDYLWIMDSTCGGHYATGEICKRLGLTFDLLPFDRQNCLIDLDGLCQLMQEKPPHLIYLDISTALRLPRISKLRETVGPEPLICLDASHVLGLLLASPEGIGLEAGATTCSGSTHKSFPGPQKGILLTNQERIATLMNERLSFAVSSAHANSVASLAITLEELMPHRVRYGQDIINNARSLAQSLHQRGFHVAGSDFGFTETHQVWIVPPDDVSPVEWGKQLMEANIRVTVVTLPVTGRPGIRVGVQELTRLGMSEPEMDVVADLMAQCVLTDTLTALVKHRVVDFVEHFSRVQYV